MTLPTYATKDCVWLDVFGVINDTLNKHPELIIELDKFIKKKREILKDI